MANTFQGKACRRCGGTERYRKGRACVACRRAYDRAQRDQDQHRASTRAWYAANSEHARQYRRAHHADNPDQARAAARARRVRARDRDLGWRVDELVVLERADGCCEHCGKDVDPFDRGTWHVDHIVPLGPGLEHPANLQLLCVDCNRKKWAKVPAAGGYPAADVQLGLCMLRFPELPPLPPLGSLILPFPG